MLLCQAVEALVVLRVAANEEAAADTRTEPGDAEVSEGVPPLHGADVDRRWAEDVVQTLESHAVSWKGLKPEDQAAKAAALKKQEEAGRKRLDEEKARREAKERKRREEEKARREAEERKRREVR